MGNGRIRLTVSVSNDPQPRLAYSELLALADDQVVAELCAGNGDAFAVIFKRYHRLIHATALHIVRDAGEAEDLTQTIFLEFYRKAGQFDSARGTLKVWLLQFAYSRSLNRRNYLAVRQHHNQADLRMVDAEESFWSMNNLPPQETSQLTSELLARLPEEQRRTIEMFFFEGLTFKEIAEQRNEKFSNVRHHYYRGIERIRTYLQDGAEPKRRRRVAVALGDMQRAET